MKGSDVFLSKFLKSDQIEEDLTVTIKDVVMEEVAKGEEKPIAYFEEIEAGLVLNKTNWGTIAEIAESDDSDDWQGTEITLYVKDDVEFQGKTVSAIRVRTKKAVKAAKKPAATKAAEAAKIMWPAEVVKALIEAKIAKNEFAATAILNNSPFDASVNAIDAVAFGKLYREAREAGLESPAAFKRANDEFVEI